MTPERRAELRARCVPSYMAVISQRELKEALDALDAADAREMVLRERLYRAHLELSDERRRG